MRRTSPFREQKSWQIVRERTIPLNITTSLPNEESLRAIEDADCIITEGKPGHKSVEELMEALEA